MTAEKHQRPSNTQLTCNSAASVGIGWLAHRIDDKPTRLAASKTHWNRTNVYVTERIVSHQADSPGNKIDCANHQIPITRCLVAQDWL
jgi:NADH:ubiquinone oxidoreductase subunit